MFTIKTSDEAFSRARRVGQGNIASYQMKAETTHLTGWSAQRCHPYMPPTAAVSHLKGGAANEPSAQLEYVRPALCQRRPSTLITKTQAAQIPALRTREGYGYVPDEIKFSCQAQGNLRATGGISRSLSSLLYTVNTPLPRILHRAIMALAFHYVSQSYGIY